MPIISLAITGVVSIIFGIIILIWPKSLSLMVGIYLILVGLIQVFGGWY